MPKFVFAYFGRPNFETEKEGQAHMGEWREWLAGLGDAVVDVGMPIGPGATFAASGPVADGVQSALSGITVVEADTVDAAEAMAKSCPHLGDDRMIHIAPAMEMS